MESRKFFHAGHVDEVILDCYRLAKYYGLDPDIFLNKPLSAVKKQLFWTGKLIETQTPPDDDAY